MVPWVMFLVGLLAVTAGAELVVRGGVLTAARLGISPMVVGVTVVALGTSAPELAIGIDAALRGSASLAIGNIVGANTYNLLFILGLVALLQPLRLHPQSLKVDLPMVVGAATLLLLLAADGLLGRLDGGVLVLFGAAYTLLIVRWVRREAAVERTAFALKGGETPREGRSRGRAVLAPVWLVTGIVSIVVGADSMVSGAVDLARGFGVSEAFIGLTIVALSTSTPELATAIVATLRSEQDIAVGNLLGSSAYNIVLILGVAALIPAGGIPIEAKLITIYIPVMLAATIACAAVFLTGRGIHRLEGATFIAAYLAYLAYLLPART